jgi:hypothetical protein
MPGLLSKKTILSNLYTAIILFTFASTAFTQEKIGYVLDINGEWYLGSVSTQNLKKGSAVPGAGVIKARSPQEVSNLIVIADLNGRIIEKRYCRDRGSCIRPIQLPSTSQNQPSLTSRIINAVMGLWGTEPVKYKTFGSRESSKALREAVVSLKDGNIDLHDVFINKSEGPYLIRFVLPANQRRIALGPLDFRLGPGNQSPIAVGALGPGLYEVELLDRNSQEPDIGTEAWLLIANPEQYQELSSSFREAVKLTESWGGDLKRTTVSSFLRAYLDHLASVIKR